MRMLVVGGDSLIGSELKNTFCSPTNDVITTTRRHPTSEYYLDLAKPDSMNWLNEQEFDVAFICASLTNIKYCEENQEEVNKVNIEGVISIIDILLSLKAHIIWFSSDQAYLYDGANKKNNKGGGSRNYYGESKAIVEDYLKKSGGLYTIVRPAKIVDSIWSLILKWNRERNGKISAFSDHYFSPITLPFLMNHIETIVSRKKYGVLNFMASQSLSYYELAKKVWERCEVEPILAHSAGIEPHSPIEDDCKKRVQGLVIQDLDSVLHYIKQKLSVYR